MEDVNTRNLWTFELSTQEGMKNPIMKIVGFEQSGRQGSQNFINITFFRPPVTSAHCIFSTEKNWMLLKYDDDDDCIQGYGQNTKFLEH